MPGETGLVAGRSLGLHDVPGGAREGRGDVYISFIGIRTLFDQITRGYGDHSPLTRPKEEVCRRRFK